MNTTCGDHFLYYLSSASYILCGFRPLFLQTVSVLLNTSGASATTTDSGGDVSFTGKEGYLTLLGSVGKAVAVGSEAGEDLDEISTEFLDLKVPVMSPRVFLAERLRLL